MYRRPAVIVLVNLVGGLLWWWGTRDLEVALSAAVFGVLAGWLGPRLTRTSRRGKAQEYGLAGLVLPVVMFGLLAWLMKRFLPPFWR